MVERRIKSRDNAAEMYLEYRDSFGHTQSETTDVAERAGNGAGRIGHSPSSDDASCMDRDGERQI